MTVIIEGQNIDNLEDFYDQIEKHLIIGECPWGRNLDSLQEIVQSNFNYTDDKALDVSEIIWRQSATVKEKLGKSATIEWWSHKLSTASSSEQREQIKQRIKQVEDGHEPTLFETLKEILSSNNDIRLSIE